MSIELFHVINCFNVKIKPFKVASITCLRAWLNLSDWLKSTRQ